MHTRTSDLVGLAAALACTSLVQGAYIGLQLQFIGQMSTPAGPKKVYRIYAQFTEGSDRVIAWGGTSVNPTNIHTIHCTVPTLQLGAPFFQAPSGENMAPSQAVINAEPEAQWDTFVTIGVSVADQGSGPPGMPDETRLQGNFSTLNSNQLTLTGAVVTTATADAAQARADYAGDGDLPLRVLLGQFSIDPNDALDGRIGTLSVSSDGTPLTLTNLPLTFQMFGWGACCLPNGAPCSFMSGLVCEGFLSGVLMCECEKCPKSCLGDIVLNGAVDVDDLIEVIETWGPCSTGACPPGTCASDINPPGPPPGDCVVDVDDLIAVILAWGPCG